MKFSEMTYTRPDIDALLATCKALAAKAAAAPDGDALVAVYYEQSRAFADYTTASQLANIHYTCDTRDASWKAEQDFFDANGPAVANAQVEISRAFLSNPHVDALTEHFGTTCVAGMKNAVLGMDDRTVDLQKEFNALVSQYQQIYGGALVELDGKQLTIPQLGPYTEDLDPTVRRASTPDGRVYTLTDTVGFVRDLPHELIEAFRSTLEEVGGADLVLHVVDTAPPAPVGQVTAVRAVLADLPGGLDVPELVVLNKVDLAAAVHALVSESGCSQSALEQAIRVLEEKHQETEEYDLYDPYG